ncbi:MAG: hypothetical protein QM737_17685 [Ferruginibacter sp.]
MKQIFICCFIFQASFAFAQIQTSAFKPDAVTNLKLRKEQYKFPAGLNISNLTILDARTDTTSIGYSPGKRSKKYCFKDGFINEMNNWFFKYLMLAENNANGNTLLINIKKLRISEEATQKILETGKVARENNDWKNEPTPRTRQDGRIIREENNQWENGVIVLIEYYLQKDSMYIPLYRFDSIIPLVGGTSRYAEAFISIGLRSSLVKLFTCTQDSSLLSKKRYSWADIERVNKKISRFPVLTNDEHQKGVYKTFNDFKLNIVSWTDFEMRKGKMGDIIYIKENNKEYPQQDVWGYCDGKDFYINSAHKFSKLIRTGDTYYFQGIKSLSPKDNFIGNPFSELAAGASVPASDGVSGGTINPAEYDIVLKYYQLDMENGKTY